MALFLGLLSIVIAGGLAVLLPIASWLRSTRLERELKEVRARLAVLEEHERMRGGPTTPPPARDEPIVPVIPSTPPVDDLQSVPSLGLPAPTPTEVGLDAPLGVEPPPLPPPAPVSPGDGHSSLEEAIGGRLMLWVGTVVLVLGLAFFIKYAFDNQWITESMRVGLGIVAGMALVAAGHRFSQRGYRAYGQVLTGGGLAVLFLSVYAAYDFYDLIGRTPAFIALVMVTIAACALADRQDAIGLAVMGVGGGFATPFLVGGGTDAQVSLFSYDALLVAGTLYLSLRRDWPVLNVLSFVGTWFTVAAWADTFYTPSKWQRTEFFLTLFCVEFLAILREQVRRHGWRSGASWTLLLGPLLYHVSSLGVLQGHGVAPLVYLIAVTLVAVAVATRAGSPGWRFVAWGAVVPPLLAWLDTHGSSHWLFANLVACFGIFALHLVAQLDVVYRHDGRLSLSDTALVHLNGYALMGGLYLALEDVAVASAPGVTLLVGLGHAALAWALRHRDRRSALHMLAVALGALTVATALRLDGPWLTVALAIEGGLVISLGLRLQEGWFRAAGAALLVVAIQRYTSLSMADVPASFSLFRNEPFVMGLFLALVCFGVGWEYRRAPATTGERTTGLGAAVLLGCSLLVTALSLETYNYWVLRGDRSADARFAGSMSLSFVWAASAGAFIAVGLWREYAPIRYLAIGLFGLTVLKVFLVDLSALGGIYRILGFVGVGVALLAASFAYQRVRQRSRPVPGSPATTPPSEGPSAPGA